MSIGISLLLLYTFPNSGKTSQDTNRFHWGWMCKDGHTSGQEVDDFPISNTSFT